MIQRHLEKHLVLAVVFFSAGTPSLAQDAINSTANTGAMSHSSGLTTQTGASAAFDLSGIAPSLAPTTVRGLAPVFGGGAKRRGLPQCNMDSFVYEAAGMAELIYGDEGSDGPPPYEEFTKQHRINSGIFDLRHQGLTTGHSSYMPDAWGGDEWVDGPEFTTSGSGSNSGGTFSSF